MFKCIKQIILCNKLIVKPNINNYTRKLFNKNVENDSKAKLLIKPLIFTIGFSATTITCSCIYEYESMSIWRKLVARDHHREEHRNEIVEQLKNWWNTRSDGFKMYTGIAALNVLVFCAWKIRPFQSFMLTHFMTHSHLKPVRCLPLLLATFSHYSLIHLTLNMVILYSLTDIAVHLYGKHQFLSLYLCSGVISSFIGYSFKIITSRHSSSLGASGAILGILSACCISAPHIQFMIIFFPFFTFSGATALKSLVLFDTIGLVGKFKLLDHATHLGGTFTGVLYALYGEKLIRKYRKEVVKHWRTLKTNSRR